MKASVAITAVAAGAVLIIAPIGVSQWQLVRTAAYYEQHGTGSSIPNELRPAPFRNYDWACLILGAILAFAGLRGFAKPRIISCPQRDNAKGMNSAI